MYPRGPMQGSGYPPPPGYPPPGFAPPWQPPAPSKAARMFQVAKIGGGILVVLLTIVIFFASRHFDTKLHDGRNELGYSHGRVEEAKAREVLAFLHAEGWFTSTSAADAYIGRDDGGTYLLTLYVADKALATPAAREDTKHDLQEIANHLVRAKIFAGAPVVVRMLDKQKHEYDRLTGVLESPR